MLDAAHTTDETQTRPGGVNTLPADHARTDTHSSAVGGNHLDGGHEVNDPHSKLAPVNHLPTAIHPPETKDYPPSADLTPGHSPLDIHTAAAGGHLHNLPAASPSTTPRWFSPLVTPMDNTTHSTTESAEHDYLLLILSDALDDLERVRIATENRVRTMVSEPQNDEDTARNWSPSMREVATMAHVADTLAALEHRATLDLQHAMRAHPLGPWIKRTIGIGEKQGARLIAAIGDPAARDMPSQLLQYCGHGEPSKRKRGEKTFWNPTAKMRVHLIAESCIKQRTSPFRAVYDEARMDWADRVECPSCKAACSDGHKHNHALRMVGKAILRDLWREAKGIS